MASSNSPAMPYRTNAARRPTSASCPIEVASQIGIPAHNAPTAPTSDPTKLKTAKTPVRSVSDTVLDNVACSSGKNTLTSPALGFMVPMAATMSNTMNGVLRPKAIPVTTMSHDEYANSRSMEKRCDVTPTANVSAAEPKSDAVTTAPT